MSATVDHERDGAGSEVLRVSGEVDVASAAAVSIALNEAVARAEGSVVVDLAAVTFLDSSGVRALLGAREAALDASVELRLRNPQPAVRRVLEVTGVAPVFQL